MPLHRTLAHAQLPAGLALSVADSQARLCSPQPWIPLVPKIRGPDVVTDIDPKAAGLSFEDTAAIVWKQLHLR